MPEFVFMFLYSYIVLNYFYSSVRAFVMVDFVVDVVFWHLSGAWDDVLQGCVLGVRTVHQLAPLGHGFLTKIKPSRGDIRPGEFKLKAVRSRNTLLSLDTFVNGWGLPVKGSWIHFFVIY